MYLILIYPIWNRNGKEMSFWCDINWACSLIHGPRGEPMGHLEVYCLHPLGADSHLRCFYSM